LYLNPALAVRLSTFPLQNTMLQYSSAALKLIFLCRSPFVCGSLFGMCVERVNASYMQGALFTALLNGNEIILV